MPRHKLTPDDSRKGAQAAAETKRRKRQEERELLSEARAEHLDDAIETLSGIAKKAADAIDHLLDAESESVRLRAAVSVLELLLDCEIREMSDRLSRLEDARSTNQATDGADTEKRDRLQAATTGDPKPSAPQRPRSRQLTRVNDFTLSQSSCGVALFRVVLVHPARPRPRCAG